MSTPFKSQIQTTLDDGVVLDVSTENAEFTAFVVISEPDIERVSRIVPRNHFEQGGDVHVAAVDSADDAIDTVNDITFNMNPGDSVVFMCIDAAAYSETLSWLGQS